jgi:hypothetical protein
MPARIPEAEVALNEINDPEQDLLGLLHSSALGSPRAISAYNAQPVELQDLAPQQVFSRLTYTKPATSIIDRQGETIQFLHDLLDLSNFTLPPTAVEVADEDERNKFRIGIKQTYAALTDIEDLDDAVEKTRKFFTSAIEHLQPPTIDGVQIVTWDIAPAESFEGLRDRLNEALMSDFSGLSDAIGLAVIDAAWVQEFDEDGNSGRIQFGPMQSDELAQRMSVPPRSDDPPNMLGIMADVTFATGSVDSAEAVAMWESSLEKQRGMIDRVGRWIKEKVA